jgi:hypothetical protein
MAVGSFSSTYGAGVAADCPSIPSSLIYDDMDVASGGVARASSISTTFVTVYSYTGQGMFYGFDIGLAGGLFGGNLWILQCTVDGNNIFGANGIATNDIGNNSLYGYAVGQFPFLGITTQTNNVTFQWPYPIAFNSSIKIQVKKTTGSAAFNAGFVLRS